MLFRSQAWSCALWAVVAFACLVSAGATDKDGQLQTSVVHVAAAKAAEPAVKPAAVAGSGGSGVVAFDAPIKVSGQLQATRVLKVEHSKLAIAALQKKGGDGVAPSELHASLSQASISKRFKSVHNKQLAKIRMGEKALIGTYPSPSAKNIHDSLEWMPFVLPPLGLLLLGGVTFGVVTIRKQHKIPNLPTQGRLDIKDVQASARQMQQKV